MTQPPAGTRDGRFWFSAYKHCLLLAALLIIWLAQALIYGAAGGLLVLNALLTVLLFIVFLVVFEGRRERAIALVVTLLAIATRWGTYGPSAALRFTATALHHALIVLFMAYAVVVILAHIFRRRRINADHIAGAACGYLLAAIGWGSFYLLIELYAPGSFQFVPEVLSQLPNEHARSYLFNYFSLARLTGVEYRNVSAAVPDVASLVLIEVLFGQFYMAVLVAQLVGLSLASRLDRGSEPGRE